MAAYLQTNEIGVKRTTVEVTVPDNDVARLMYYLNCVCTTIDYKDDANLQRFISYQNWNQLLINEQKALVDACRALSPNLLNDKVFFQYDEISTGFRNEFFEISQVRNQLLAAESIVIAGRTRQVNKIMLYKKDWLRDYYTEPMRRLTSRFSNSASSTVTYTRTPTYIQPYTYTQPVVVKDNNSNKFKYICCGIICLVLFIVPTIIGIIVGVVNSKK